MKKNIVIITLSFSMMLSILFCKDFFINEKENTSLAGDYLYIEEMQDLNDVLAHSTIEEMQDLNDVLAYSTNIVKAKLLSQKDFDGFVNVYTFSLEEDYTNNTSKEIHVYDEYNGNYIVGHSYCLFLESDDTALFPHTIYTTVKKDLIIDITSGQVLGFDDVDEIQMFVANIDETAFINKNILGVKVVEERFNILDNNDIISVIENADVVAIIQISAEQQANKYASSYEINLVEVLKGDVGSIATHMILPPNLRENTNYYVFLKEDPANPGTYLLFSRVMPILEATEDNVKEISMILE